MSWPISFEDVLHARQRLKPYLDPTPLRQYATLDKAVGSEMGVLVKHENFNPTGAFKVRNALSVMTTLSAEEKRRGVVAATRGNHGLGLAYAGKLLGVSVTVCVPHGNNPEKNEAMQGLGATLIEEGKDYDESVLAADRLVDERGLRLVHSTNDALILAGAATITLEMVEEAQSLDALVFSLGGGSQAVGAMTVARRLMPSLQIYAAQSEAASAGHDSWLAKKPVETASAQTFADGIATRKSYELTLQPLIDGLAGFVTVSEAEIAEALRLLLRTTHSLVEGAGAAGLAGLIKLREKLAGKTVGIVLSGGNIDQATLRRVVNREI